MEIALVKLLFSAISGVINLAVDGWKNDGIFMNAAIIARDSVVRELKLCLAILDDLESVESEESKSALLSQLSSASFDAVESSGFPLRYIFTGEFDAGRYTGIISGYAGSGRYVNYMAKIESNVDLVERTYIRLKMYMIRNKAGVEISDIDYLKCLLRISVVALKNIL